MSDIVRVVLHNPDNDADAAITPAGDLYVVTGVRTDALFNDGTLLTPKFAVINASTNGDNEIIPLVSGKKIRVLQFLFVCGAAVDVRFESSAGGAALTGVMEIAANSGVGAAFNSVGHFETVAGENLSMELSGAVNTDGWLVYVEV